MNKKIRKNWLAILGLISISATSIVGSCTSLYFGYKNYEKGSDFEKSYNLRMELNTDQTEDPWNIPARSSYEELVEKTKKSVDSFNRYLTKKNKSDYSVYSEVIEEASKNYRAFLNVVVPNEQVKSKSDPDVKIDKVTGEIYFEYYSTPKITILYSDENNKYYEFSQEFLTNSTWNNISIGGDNKQQVDIKLDDTTFDLKQILDKMTPSKKDPSNVTTYQPYMYVFKDQVGLLNRMKYIVSLEKTSDEYDALSDSEKQFWTDSTDRYLDHDFSPLKISKPNEAFSEIKTSETKNLNSASVLIPENTQDGRSFIESVSWEDGQMKHSGTVKYSFMDEYILGIIKREEAEADLTSFRKFFPEQNPTDSKKESENKWMVIGQKNSAQTTPTKFENELLYNGITTNKLELPILTSSIEQIKSGIIKESNIFVINPSFDNNFFGMNSLMGVVISAAIIIFILGIIVSILYRVPGFISFLLILLMISLSFLTLSMVGYVISGTLVCGLFIGFLIGLLGAINCFERIKKEIGIGYTTYISSKKGLTKAFMPLLDICIVALLCGVGLVYIGSGQFLSLGVLMILVGFLALPIVYGGQSLTMLALYRNDVVGKEKIELFIATPKTIHSNTLTTFETTFNQKKLKIPFNLFNKKLLITLGTIFSILTIVALSIMFSIGDLNSLAYSGGTRIMIDSNYIQNNFGGNIELFIQMIGGNWKSSGINGSHWVITSASSINFADIVAKIISSKPAPTIDQLLVQTAIPNNFTVLTNTTVRMIFSISGFLAAYSLIRFNWISIIPVFIGILLAPAITILLFVSCQIYIDQTIVSAVAIGFIINCLLVFNHMGNIANKSVKKEKGDLNSLKNVLNIQIWSSKLFFGVTILFLIISLVAMSLLISPSIVSLILMVFTTAIASAFVCFFFIPQAYILFKLISNKYSQRVQKIESRQEIYDNVDEQLIPGINSEK